MVSEQPVRYAGPAPNIDDVRLALALLRGRCEIIRLRLQRSPKENQEALLRSLDEIDARIWEITRQLEDFEHGTFGPP